jgi:hypothetical protein
MYWHRSQIKWEIKKIFEASLLTNVESVAEGRGIGSTTCKYIAGIGRSYVATSNDLGI